MKLVWYSEIKWNYLQTRKQHLIKLFPSSDTILYFQPFSFIGKNHFFPKKEGNIYYITLPTYRKSNYQIIDKYFSNSTIRKVFYHLLQWYAKFWIKVILQQVPDCICISNIFYLPLINSTTPVVWDFNDHPEQFGKQPEWALKGFDIFLKDKQNHIISSSIGIAEYLNEKFKRKTLIIPNGVDLNHFNKKIQWKEDPKMDVIGYVGIISSWFLDFELLHKISEHFNSYEIHLYGPCERNAQQKLNKLIQRPNIIYQGQQSYNSLPKIMRTFKVGIIPLYSKPEVWRLASGKFLQYLGVGIPVVSVWMKQYSKLTKNVFLAKSHKEFITKLNNAIEHEFLTMDKALQEYDWRKLSTEFRNKLITLNG